jgi:hypothetical protein
MGYLVVCAIEAVLLFISLLLLRQIDVEAFVQQAEHQTVAERAALVGEAAGIIAWSYGSSLISLLPQVPGDRHQYYKRSHHLPK